jgi:hypothetical protein
MAIGTGTDSTKRNHSKVHLESKCPPLQCLLDNPDPKLVVCNALGRVDKCWGGDCGGSVRDGLTSVIGTEYQRL